MNTFVAGTTQAQSTLGIWFWIILFVLVVFIVAWLLLRNTKVPPPDLHTGHGHESHDEHASHEEHGAEEPAAHEEAAAAVETPPVLEEAPPAEPVVEEAAPVVTGVVEGAAEEIRLPDDLTILEGIGPKAGEALNAAGITTFAQLAAADLEQIKAILAANGLRLLDPGTWKEQAALAADGKMDDLQALMASLKGGRRAG